MIIKCPKCAERFEIEAGWLNGRGVCPHCQSSILFSNGKTAPPIAQPPYSIDSRQNSGWRKAGIVIAVLFLFLALISSLLSDCYRSRAPKYPSSSRSSSFQRLSENFDFEKEQARSYIDSLPEGQRRAFYGGSNDSADKMNLLTNILDSGNLDGTIKLLEK